MQIEAKIDILAVSMLPSESNWIEKNDFRNNRSERCFREQYSIVIVAFFSAVDVTVGVRVEHKTEGLRQKCEKSKS